MTARAATAPEIAFTAADSFGNGLICGRTLTAWQRETARLLPTVRVNQRVDARRLTALEVHFADAREMAVLNYRHLRHRGATDVLTFPLELLPPPARGKKPWRARKPSRDPHPAVAGVVIVCPAVATREAKARQLPAQEELLRYILHGVLHLLGEDDKTTAARKRMHAIQEKLLGAWFVGGRRAGR